VRTNYGDLVVLLEQGRVVLDSPSTYTKAEKFACPCGVGKITDESGTCPLSPANTYQPVIGKQTAIACPPRSESKEGSVKIEDCQCGKGLSMEYDHNSDGTRGNFACYCDEGSYLITITNQRARTSTHECLKCNICDPGHYKKGCEKESPGTCEPCQVCASASQKLAG
jgi:hypothetical protein